MKFYFLFFLLVVFIFCYGCFEPTFHDSGKLKLSGKLLIRTEVDPEVECYKFLNNKKVVNFSVHAYSQQGRQIHVRSIVNDSNLLFTCIEQKDSAYCFSNSKTKRFKWRVSFALIDTLGRPVRTLLSLDDCCLRCSSASLSTDMKLAFTVGNGCSDSLIVGNKNERNIWGGLTVYDVKSGKEILNLDSLGELGGITLFPHNGWSMDNHKLLYEINKNSIHLKQDRSDSELKNLIDKTDGLYFIDIYSNTKTLIARHSYLGAWSPVKNEIAFSNGSDINLYDVATKKSNQIFEGFSNKEVRIDDLIWSPNGKFVLAKFNYHYYFYERLFDVKTGKIYKLEKQMFPISWL